MSTREQPTSRCAPGDWVRVIGTTQQVCDLYGREPVDCSGIIQQVAQRTFGYERYLVHLPAHTSYTPALGLARQLPACTMDIRVAHLARTVVAPPAFSAADEGGK